MNAWRTRDPDEPHWHLGPVAVEPGLQGMGIGSQMMEEFARRMDRERAVAYLETDKLQNVMFYERFGFETIDERVVLGVPNWFMRRAAPAALGRGCVGFRAGRVLVHARRSSHRAAVTTENIGALTSISLPLPLSTRSTAASTRSPPRSITSGRLTLKSSATSKSQSQPAAQPDDRGSSSPRRRCSTPRRDPAS